MAVAVAEQEVCPELSLTKGFFLAPPPRSDKGSFVMSNLYVGLSALRGDLARYAQRFDLLEVRPVDTSLPRLSRLRQWRKEVPPSFVFSVVLPASVAELKPSAEADDALTKALATADVLQARCLVLATPPHVTPTALNQTRLRALVQRLPRDVVTVAWEPRGLWDPEDAAHVARSLNLHLVVDVAREEPPRGALLYTRLRGIGTSSRLGPSALERARETLRGRREVFVVVESAAPIAVAQALRRPLPDALPRVGNAASRGAILRPPIVLSAEDEEQ